MKFQIEKIIIWSKRAELPPREIHFQLGKVNVITGASRTGKSAIVPIIDYCLGSKNCSIPIEVIRDNASWYGIVICTDSEKILLARKVPDGNKISVECFVSRGREVAIPPLLEKNQNLDGVKELLDTIAGVSYLELDEDFGAYKDRLSFRDLTHLIFQSQNIIADQSVLFYQTHETEHREKLKNWFPFILGAETRELIQTRNDIKNVERELARISKDYNQATLLSNEWLQNLLGQLKVAKEFGLVDEKLSDKNDIDTLLRIAKGILANKPESPKTKDKNLDSIHEEIQRLEKIEHHLAQEIALRQKRQRDIEQLELSLSGFEGSTKRKVERLGISKWIRENALSIGSCPICGGKDHPNAIAEVEKICTVLEDYERITAVSAPIPAAFDREKETIKNELHELIKQKDDLQYQFDVMRSKNNEVEKYLQRTRDMFLFLGQLQSTIELIGRLTDAGGLEERKRNLEERKRNLIAIISSSDVNNKKDRALNEIAEMTLNRLKNLDVEDSYKEVQPRFSLKELGIEVQSKDGVWHLLGEVGSASNWVSFHIAFTCALQEFFAKQSRPESSVPSFIVYDQPSQVYFPRVRKNDEETDPNITDEDVEAVKSIFLTIAASIASTQGQWQAIILDHARSEIFDEIDGVVEVEEWRDGKKLIPTDWYQE
ncbi:hypothetical protein FACS1894189_3960 [Planctomycetales bacterium]|nr:hypothetical protein FACS1894189_3960 [Planctomycetales bacterium]